MALTVLGGGVSPFVRKVRVFLAEKGLDYQHENINPFGPPEGWREISPLGRIPAFKDGDKVVNDSSVICAYLERRFPKPALYPTDDYDYARALWFEEFADGGMIATMGPKTFFPCVLKPLFGGKSRARSGRRGGGREVRRRGVSEVLGLPREGARRQRVLRRQPAHDRRHRRRDGIREPALCGLRARAQALAEAARVHRAHARSPVVQDAIGRTLPFSKRACWSRTEAPERRDPAVRRPRRGGRGVPRPPRRAVLREARRRRVVDSEGRDRAGATARHGVREFHEETGFDLEFAQIEPLAPVRQSSAKTVHAFAAEGDCDPAAIRSNTFALHGRTHPEVDRAGWFGLDEARRKILRGQRPLLDALEQLLSAPAGTGG
jgi:predicted NUDIX family NTP pyrophosphohydrolase